MPHSEALSSICGFILFFVFIFGFAPSAPLAAEPLLHRFSVVLDKENLPYSSEKQSPPGLDAEIAIAIAKELGAALEIRWVDSLGDGLVSHALKQMSGVQAAIGVAVDPRLAEEGMAVGVQALYSIPYASTRYVLVTRKDFRDLNSIEETGRNELGVEVGSVAARELWNEGFMLRKFGSQDRILEALLDGKGLDYGVLWSNAGWMIGENPKLEGKLKVQLLPLGAKHVEWNLAVAVGKHNRELLPRIDGALLKMKKDGILSPLFAKYRVPYFEPFAQKGKAEP